MKWAILNGRDLLIHATFLTIFFQYPFVICILFSTQDIFLLPLLFILKQRRPIGPNIYLGSALEKSKLTKQFQSLIRNLDSHFPK